MSDTPTLDYGEPWTSPHPDFADSFNPIIQNRIIACVNACAGMADPAAEIAAMREAMKELEWEKNTRKNLQHVIVSEWGADSIGRCIDTIRQTEKGIGPLGPINDWRLAQILSAHLQQPAELIINALRQQAEELKANNKEAENSEMKKAIQTAYESLNGLDLHLPRNYSLFLLFALEKLQPYSTK